VSLKTTDIEVARERAFDQDADSAPAKTPTEPHLWNRNAKPWIPLQAITFFKFEPRGDHR